MKKTIKKIISFGLVFSCFFAMTSFSTFAAESESPQEILDVGITRLEQVYNVTIKEASTTRKISELTASEVNDSLKELEDALAKGQQARIDNQIEYENHMNELKAAGRIENNIVNNAIEPRALKVRSYYQRIGSLVPDGTIMLCQMRGNTTLDSFGNTIWGQLYSHYSGISSGYATGWQETDFSYQLMDGGRTLHCEYIGTLEEPFMNAGVIAYYVYSKGWRLWFEAYAMD